MSDVVVTRWIAASPPTVFAFFTDAERWTAWQGVGGKVDARAGGALRVIMPDAAAASGQFLEVVPPRRIVFTWGWEGNGIPVPPGSSIVTVELEPADGGTMVRLDPQRTAARRRTGAPSQRVGALPWPAGTSRNGRRPRPGPLRRLVR